MPDIKPFRGALYNQRRTSVGDIVAPPYDVITQAEQEELYQRSPYNVVRLILGKEHEPHLSAARLWKEWRETGVISFDVAPAMYLLAQRYTDQEGEVKERIGFVAACRLEEPGRGTIFPHERTLASAKEDRMRFLTTTDAFFSQIFCVYTDPQLVLEHAIADVLLTDPERICTYDEVVTRLWKVSEPEITMKFATFMKGQKVFIADGHHRYETALAYSAQKRTRNPSHTGKEAYNFVPMYFTNLHGKGLTILPTHRILHDLPEFSANTFLSMIERSFAVHAVQSLHELLESLRLTRDRTLFGMVLPSQHPLYVISPRDVSGQADGGVPSALAALDVVVFQRLIAAKVLKLTESDIRNRRFIEYEKSAEGALQSVLNNRSQAAFLMRPPRLEQVKAVAEAGFVMPEKSTYFFPKLLSGLVMYSFRPEN